MRPYTDEEIDSLEARYQMSIPAALRSLLLIGGAGSYGNVEIYELEKVDELYRSFFDDPSELFTLYLPFGERKLQQEMLVYFLREGTFAAIWHETVPDDWPEVPRRPLTIEALASLVFRDSDD